MDHLHVPVSYIGGGGVQRDQYDRLSERESLGAYRTARHLFIGRFRHGIAVT